MTDAELGLKRTVEGGIATITLDRPKALNALNRDQFVALHEWLSGWAVDAQIRAVVIKGEGGRAFCAGGDIRATYERRGDAAFMRSVYGSEYRLNHLIKTFPKPYVALMDGIVMGGGCGVSVHGSRRIVTETTMMAMPESAIGLFCDIGAGYFLPRAPGRIGEYLALTGRRINAADALHCGFADHFMAREKLPELEARIRAGADVDAAIEGLAGDAGAAPIAALQDAIDRNFDGGSVEVILMQLEREGSAWAAAIRSELLQLCPFSLVTNLRLVRDGRHRPIEEVLRADYRRALRFMERNDFFEGVRARLVDKDNAPRWQPSRIEEVDPAEVDHCFSLLAEGELSFD